MMMQSSIKPPSIKNDVTLLKGRYLQILRTLQLNLKIFLISDGQRQVFVSLFQMR